MEYVNGWPCHRRKHETQLLLSSPHYHLILIKDSRKFHPHIISRWIKFIISSSAIIIMKEIGPKIDSIIKYVFYDLTQWIVII